MNNAMSKTNNILRKNAKKSEKKMYMKFSVFLLTLLMVAGTVSPVFAYYYGPDLDVDTVSSAGTATNGSSKAYAVKWVRVKSLDELNKMLVKNATSAAVTVGALDTNQASVKDASLVMILHQADDGKYYYMSCNHSGGTYYACEELNTGSSVCLTDFDPENGFVTAITNENSVSNRTPFIKLIKEDNSWWQSNEYSYGLISKYYSSFSNWGFRSYVTWGCSYKDSNSDDYNDEDEAWGQIVYSSYTLGHCWFKSTGVNSRYNSYGIKIDFPGNGLASFSTEHECGHHTYYKEEDFDWDGDWDDLDDDEFDKVNLYAKYNSTYYAYYRFDKSNHNLYAEPVAKNLNLLEYVEKYGSLFNTSKIKPSIIDYTSAGALNNANMTFMVFIGEFIEQPSLSNNTNIEGVRVIRDRTTVEDGSTVVISAGATLVVENTLINKGTIRVDGGKLIVKDLLTDAASTCTTVSIDVVNGGTLMVLEGGGILSQSDGCNFSINLDRSAHLYNEGIIAVKSIKLSRRSRLYSLKNSRLLPGYIVSTPNEIRSYIDGTYIKIIKGISTVASYLYIGNPIYFDPSGTASVLMSSGAAVYTTRATTGGGVYTK